MDLFANNHLYYLIKLLLRLMLLSPSRTSQLVFLVDFSFFSFDTLFVNFGGVLLSNEALIFDFETLRPNFLYPDFSFSIHCSEQQQQFPYLNGVQVTLKQAQHAFLSRLFAYFEIKLKLWPPALYRNEKDPGDRIGEGSFFGDSLLLLIFVIAVLFKKEVSEVFEISVFGLFLLLMLV